MEIINLPESEFGYAFVGMSFSAPPTSSDCIVFGATQGLQYLDEMSAIFYFKAQDENGKDTWYTDWHWVDHQIKYEFVASYCNPVFCEGVFYCLNDVGKLATFHLTFPDEEEAAAKEGDVFESDWKILDVPPLFRYRKLKKFRTAGRSFLVECEGEILSVFVGYTCKSVQVYKLDKSQGTM